MQGIISYAGLEEHALWEGARRTFALAEGVVPARFRSFVPLFPQELVVNMRYVGPGPYASPSGFSISPDEYHAQLSQRFPALYEGDNAARCFDGEGRFMNGRNVTVDPAWIAQFPQYQPFAGERLYVHMIGGGCQAVAVPESIYPRGGGILGGAEQDLRITAASERYADYVRGRIAAGEEADFEAFENAYLAQTGLTPVSIRQRELSRVLQETAILRSLDQEEELPQPSSRPDRIPQYTPYRYAADVFEEAPLTRSTARLLQLYCSGDRYAGDLWLPYQEASQYIHKKRRTLDVRALCEGFQIAPACDVDTRGGCYPDRVRVVVVRDRAIRPMVADTINNPAYGSGMNPLGMVNKLVWIPGSEALIREKRLGEEPCPVTCINTRVEEAEYLRMRLLAELQENKGRLIDAMYSRETALRQLQPGSRAYEHAREAMDARVERLQHMAQSQLTSPPSGYDEDIAYLQRMAQCRENGEDFAADRLRERAIESGFAIRTTAGSYALSELCEKPVDERSQPALRPGRTVREQAANGVWYEQMSLFPDEEETEE